MVLNKILPNQAASYPLFEANQVLTNDHLNSLARYLEQQERLTRICLLGAGIVCGLEPQWDAGNEDAAPALVLSAGVGVTSEGFLIQLAETRFSFYKTTGKAIDLVKWLPREPEIASGDIWQMLEATEPEALTLTQPDLTGKVLLLMLDCEERKNELCLNDCDGKGAEQAFIPLLFALDEGLAKAILEAAYNPRDEEEVPKYPGKEVQDLFEDQFNVPRLYVERFGYRADDSGKSVRLSNIQSFGSLLDYYKKVITLLIPRIESAFKKAHEIFSPIFTEEKIAEAEKLTLPEALKNRLNLPEFHRFEIQYLYDLLCDISEAYNELMDVAIDLVSDCLPDTSRFPKHLWLGKWGESSDYPVSFFRTPWTQPPVYNGNAARLKEARILYERLRVMTQSYAPFVVVLSDGSQVRITPGNGSRSPISERAIPFYYNKDSNIRDWWNPRLGRLKFSHRQYGYHQWAPAGSNPPYDEPLLFKWGTGDFLRIEGHIGMGQDYAVQLLTQKRDAYNLPFDIVAVKLSNNLTDDDVLWECRLQDLEAQYSKLRTDLLCSRGQFVDSPIAVQPIDINNALPPNLKDFNLDEFKAAFAQSQLPCDIRIEPFEKISTLFNEYILEVKRQRLFPWFALAHPGLEHKGGVPIGGTFVLVYSDPEEVNGEIDNGILRLGLTNNFNITVLRQSNVVVADFCLPYLCCSHCPPIAFVTPRPKPLLDIKPTVFCRGDQTSHKLTVQAYPSGGQLSGTGIHKDNDGDWAFTPSDAPANSNQVEVTYFIDGGTATFLLGIQEPLNADFDPEVDVICWNVDEIIPMNPTVAGGVFAAYYLDANQVIDETKKIGGAFNGSELILSAVDLGQNERIPITILHQMAGLCPRQSRQTITVFAPADPDFNLPESSVCLQSTQVVQLTPAAGPNRTYAIQLPPSQSGLSSVVITLPASSFTPSDVFDGLQMNADTVVQVISRVNNGPCTATAQKPLTVTLPPNPNFSLQLAPSNNAEEFLLRLNNVQPSNATTPPEWTFTPNSSSSGVESDAQGLFVRYKFGQFNSDNTLITVSMTVNQGGCIGKETREIQVILPQIIRLEVYGTGTQFPVPRLIKILEAFDETIELSLIQEFGYQNILVRALANPATQSVHFEINLPNGTSQVVNKNTSANGAADSNFLAIIPGSLNSQPYVVLSTPHHAVNAGVITGPQFVRRFRIIEDFDPIVSPEPDLPGGELNALFNNRTALVRESVKNLGTNDAKVEKNTNFRQAVIFLNTPTSDLAKLNTDYAVISMHIISKIGKPGGMPPEKAQELLAQMTAFYLDRHIAASPTKVSPEAAKNVKNIVKNMKAVKLDPASLSAAWKGTELTKPLKIKSLKPWQLLFDKQLADDGPAENE